MNGKCVYLTCPDKPNFVRTTPIFRPDHTIFTSGPYPIFRQYHKHFCCVLILLINCNF